MRDILFAFLVAQIFLNAVFFVVIAMKSLPKQGKLTLLGWSRIAFAKEVLGGFFLMSVIDIPVLMLANALIAGWGGFSLPVLGCYLAAACINVLITVKEFEIFALLILNPKRVFTYEMLLELVWHEDYSYYSRKAINNHISNLRKKLRIAPDLPEYVKSVYGVGYKFEV